MKNHILIVEDEDAIRKGLSDVFSFNNYDVTAVGTGKEGLREALSGRHHMILLDIMLPEVSGLEICEQVRKQDRAQPIILLTAKGDEEDIIKGLQMGADDYVCKPFSVRELLARVEAVLRRSPKLNAAAEMIHWGDMTIDPHNLTLTRNNTTIELTRREVDILRYLIKNTHRPVTRQELLKEVWGYGNSLIETRTVDIHMAKLRRKIEEDSQNPKLIITVRGAGYKLESL